MNFNSLIPLVAALAYIPLFCILISNRPWQKQHWLFAAYLASATAWSISTFLLRSEFFPDDKVLIFQINICTMVWVLAQYYYFLKFHLYGSGNSIMRLGYALLGTVFIGCILGYIPKDLIVQGGEVTVNLGWWMILISLPPAYIMLRLMHFLVKRFRVSDDPTERNRIKYFFAGVVFVSILAFINPTPIGTKLPVTHIGHLINAIILTYAFLKYRILDTTFIFRRVVFYGLMTGLYLFVYLSWLFLIHIVFGISLDLVSCTIIAILTGLTLAGFWVRARIFFSQKTEELFYHNSYSQRQELADFVRNKIL
jgi:hypothetical protein